MDIILEMTKEKLTKMMGDVAAGINQNDPHDKVRRAHILHKLASKLADKQYSSRVKVS